MKRFSQLVILSLSVFLFSCGGGETPVDTVEDEVIEEKEVWSSMEINDGGYVCSMEFPPMDQSGGEAEVFFDENSGELHIKAGKRIDLILLEDESQMNMVKNELNDHPFYSVEYSMQNDSALIYRLYDEAGGSEQWHCYAEKQSPYGKWLIRSNEEGKFSEYDVKLMMSVVERITIK